MSLSETALSNLDSHWAVSSIPSTRRERAAEVARYRLVQSAVGRHMSLDFSERDGDESNLEKVAMAYELAAIEGIDALLRSSSDTRNELLRDQAQAGAFRAYELRRALPVRSSDGERTFEILHRGALAYCSDRWTDLRRWLKENPALVAAPSVANAAWDERVLYRIYDCWIRLFRKNQWDDLDRVREIIAGLRVDQKQHEAVLLQAAKETGSNATAFRLVALYHWAKATEQLAVFMLQGEPPAVDTELDQHFELARSAAQDSGDASLDVLLRWLHVASRQMVASSIWWVARKVNSRVSRFVSQAAKRSMFELLPPQRAALQEQGLLDQANQAVVVNLPTSGGKTVLAQFRMLQALNQFADDDGWVAYVAPTRALVSQITRRLRTDFEPLGINVEYLSAAVDLDGCERSLLQEKEAAKSFHVLIATPEKLNLLIRNRVVDRPLALVVMDEAHNIEDEERGLRVELLLATIKRDCPKANYLLLMPHVPNAKDLASWLGAGSGRTISLGTSAWQPNERIVGLFDVKQDSSVRGGWQLEYETLTTTPKTLHLKGRHKVGGVRPLANVAFSAAKSATTQAGAMARVFSERGTSIAVARTIPDCWSLSRTLTKDMPVLESIPHEIELVRRFLATEISDDFELATMLQHGVGVHHAGLSEETRALVEWLTESGKLRVLCATTTIAQGINFPVASVFLASRSLPARNWSREMPKRAFWNLAGRAGRVGQDSVGVVGLAGGSDRRATMRFIQEATEELISRLVTMLREISDAELGNMAQVIHREQWSDFRSYIAHLYNEAKDLNKTLAETEQALRNTFGYGALQASNSQDRRRAAALLNAAKAYAHELNEHPENAALADATGFDPEGVRTAILEMNNLEKKLKPSDWQPESLFGAHANSVLPQLVGVMMKIPQIGKQLDDIGGDGIDRKKVALLAKDWVNGKSIKEIAEKYFVSADKTSTEAISQACKGIYRALANSGTWGLAALSKMGTSGLDFENMTDDERMVVNNIPAMLYHGVNTESAVLMRINSVPRSIAPKLGEKFAVAKQGNPDIHNSRSARDFLRRLSVEDWQKAAPQNSALSGSDYRDVWQLLAGERGGF
jgi:replicative superfamily II helicase